MKKFLITMIFCILFSCLAPTAHALDVPKLQGYVNDYATMISPSVINKLENELRAFEQTDSTQIVILTIPSLEGEVIEDFSIKVADAWKIGQKGKDNGVIFLVAKQDRKMRIEVGRGLEGKVTDLMAGRIVDLVIKPRFKRGDFDGGFIAGVHALIDGTRGEFKAEEKKRFQSHDNISSLFTLLIFGAIVLLVLGSMSRILGGISGAVGLPLIVHTLFPVGLIMIGIIALIGLITGLFLPSIFSGGKRYRKGGFWPGGGIYWGGGGISSSGGFGGGFSGGGGGFGGGGASGSW